MVKHLTSKSSSNGSEIGECFNDVSSNTPKQQPPPQHKKQVRRRLHTSKPYQERLLNMAEARREIVTALKFHRASMKQQEAATAAAVAAATDNHHHSPQQKVTFDQERKKPKSGTILSLYPSTTVTATATTANPYWPMSTFAQPPPPPLPPSYHVNKNFILPSQPLGLSLNFQSFRNLETNIYHKPFSIYSSSSTPSSSSSPAGNLTSSTDLLHGTEWKDTINLVTSASNEDECDHGFHLLDQNMEFPSWLINANESSCLQQQFGDHDVYFQDPALPCMDIGEIEAMDWLA